MADTPTATVPLVVGAGVVVVGWSAVVILLVVAGEAEASVALVLWRS